MITAQASDPPSTPPSSADQSSMTILEAMALLEQTPAILYTEQCDGIESLSYVSPSVEALTGLPAEVFLRDRSVWTACIHADDRVRVRTEADRCSATGDPFAANYRLVAADGRVCWIEDRARLVRDAAGKPHRWQEIGRASCRERV